MNSIAFFNLNFCFDLSEGCIVKLFPKILICFFKKGISSKNMQFYLSIANKKK